MMASSLIRAVGDANSEKTGGVGSVTFGYERNISAIGQKNIRLYNCPKIRGPNGISEYQRILAYSRAGGIAPGNAINAVAGHNNNTRRIIGQDRPFGGIQRRPSCEITGNHICRIRIGIDYADAAHSHIFAEILSFTWIHAD